jgi:hypothetical protein
VEAGTRSVSLSHAASIAIECARGKRGPGRARSPTTLMRAEGTVHKTSISVATIPSATTRAVHFEIRIGVGCTMGLVPFLGLALSKSFISTSLGQIPDEFASRPPQNTGSG